MVAVLYVLEILKTNKSGFPVISLSEIRKYFAQTNNI